MSEGDVIAGRFVVEALELGRGATGVVHAAIETQTGRRLAVKALHPWLVEDPLALASLRAEAASAGRLQHPHVVGVLGLWQHGDHAYLVSERVEGPSLAERVGAPLDHDSAMVVGIQLAEALEAAHAAGLVHGDVRPGNVLLGPTGARLFDFGIASSVATRGPSAAPLPTLRAGETAPEILDGGPPVAASDLYGLGVTLHFALLGHLPWAGPTPFADMEAQRRMPPPLTELPRGLRGLLRALLHPQPDRRPAPGAVLPALRALRRRPGRPVSLATRWLAPIRPLRAWVVHGVDPATGGPALVQSGLSGPAARAMVRRLQQEGWSVMATRESLDLRDLALAGVAAVLAGWVVPILGFVVVAALVLRWRSARVRDRIREVLPRVASTLPPRRAPPGNEVAVVAGALFFALAAALSWWPVMALPIVGALVWLAAHSWRDRRRDIATIALDARVHTALAEAEAAIELRAADLDEHLALLGEYGVLERGWRTGALQADVVLARVDRLTARARDNP